MSTSADNSLVLRRLHLDNYKCMSNFELSFQDDFTLLLGRNGSGKSAVFEALDLLHRFVCREGKVTELFPFASLSRWSDDGKQTFELEVGDVEGKEVFLYRLVVEHEEPQPEFEISAREKARVLEETLTANGRPLFSFLNGKIRLYRDDHTEGPEFPFDWGASGLATVLAGNDNTRLAKFRRWLNGVVMLSLNVAAMRGGSNSEAAHLDADGCNFASWYRGRLQEDPPKMTEADDMLRDILPGYEGLRLLKTGGASYRELGARFALPGSDEIHEFCRLSQGQRALIALYMVIFGGAHRLLLLDHPENFVMLSEIQPLLAELEDESGDTLPQVAVISHHPEAMNFIAPRCLVWMEREEQHYTRTREFKNDTGLFTSELVAREMTP